MISFYNKESSPGTIDITRFSRNSLSSIGEGNGTPLQYSCLENPMDRGAWWAAIHGVTTEQLHFHFSLSCIREGNGNPLQCSCLENPMDGGAWWAAVYGVTQSQTRLKRLSSSSSTLFYSSPTVPPDSVIESSEWDNEACFPRIFRTLVESIWDCLKKG